MKVVCLVGLPGSGKTFVGRQIAIENGGEGWFFDDISQPRSQFDYAHAPTVFERFVSRITDPFFTQHLPKEKHVAVLTDVNLCEPEQREKAIETIRHYRPDAEIEWIFFENAPDKCRKNVFLRSDGRKVEETIRRFSKSYVIPEGVTPRPVWQSE